MKQNPNLKWVYLIALALIWGSSFILMKHGLKVYRPDQLAAIRITVASIATMCFVGTRITTVPRRLIPYLLVVGLMGSGIPAFLFATAQTHIESSLAGMLNGLTPVFTLLIGGVLFRTRFRAVQVIGVLLGFIGASALIFFRDEGGLTTGAAYASLIVIATFCYGMSVNTIKAKLGELDSILISGASLLMVGVPYCIYLFCTDFPQRFTAVPGGVAAFGFIALLALMGTAVSNVLYFQMVKISSPLFASACTYLIPVVAMGWGMMEGEQLRPLHILSMLLILGGVGLISIRPKGGN